MPTFRITATHRETTTGATNTTFGRSNVEVTATGEHEDRRVVSIDTSEEQFSIDSDVGDNGICYMENKDSTNYVDVGFSTGIYGIRLKPGEPNQVRLAPSVTSLFCVANTAACNVLFHVRED